MLAYSLVEVLALPLAPSLEIIPDLELGASLLCSLRICPRFLADSTYKANVRFTLVPSSFGWSNKNERVLMAPHRTLSIESQSKCRLLLAGRRYTKSALFSMLLANEIFYLLICTTNVSRKIKSAIATMKKFLFLTSFYILRAYLKIRRCKNILWVVQNYITHGMMLFKHFFA